MTLLKIKASKGSLELWQQTIKQTKFLVPKTIDKALQALTLLYLNKN